MLDLRFNSKSQPIRLDDDAAKTKVSCQRIIHNNDYVFLADICILRVAKIIRSECFLDKSSIWASQMIRFVDFMNIARILSKLFLCFLLLPNSHVKLQEIFSQRSQLV